MFEGELTIVRPLALVEEKDIVYYARAGNFYQAAACCPQGEHSQRATMAELLRTVKKDNPQGSDQPVQCPGTGGRLGSRRPAPTKSGRRDGQFRAAQQELEQSDCPDSRRGLCRRP